MVEIRTFFAFIIFLVGCYCLYDVCTIGFSYAMLGGAAISFFIAHCILPKNRRNKESALDYLDLLEFIIEVPYQICSLVVRLVGRIFSSKDGLDIDI